MIIGPFKGKYRFLSNMYIAPFHIGKLQYRSVENYYQASKAADMKDFVKICNCNPYEAKRFGRKVQIRNDWEEVKNRIMLEVVFHKFNQNKSLREKLLTTNSKRLVELNWWHDNYWGDCVCKKCINIRGQNVLGNILMLVRTMLTADLNKEITNV